MHHDPADKSGDKCPEKARAEAVTHPGTNRARSQRGAFGNGVANVCGEERHHQRQPGDTDIKQFFKIRIGGGIGYGALAI
ncbi:Uncharacterised protein [Salmonella enterica subsp. enterica serovar Bovismorbificans]|uniref:Uncharacterized protein n=1 Tax=Salmonella enterica subsp. enterica serovar Bovismorbificans TaxID=58097 RepID=A0A655BY76_SALET|nr:Uncharacterised protein [Salmonella enterica subsp. enterica serovar Bovismorbificans]